MVLRRNIKACCFGSAIKWLGESSGSSIASSHPNAPPSATTCAFLGHYLCRSDVFIDLNCTHIRPWCSHQSSSVWFRFIEWCSSRRRATRPRRFLEYWDKGLRNCNRRRYQGFWRYFVRHRFQLQGMRSFYFFYSPILTFNGRVPSFSLSSGRVSWWLTHRWPRIPRSHPLFQSGSWWILSHRPEARCTTSWAIARDYRATIGCTRPQTTRLLS